MPHVRTSLRNYLTTQLASVNATVLMEQAVRVGPEDMPAVLVSLTATEPQDDWTMGDPEYRIEAQQTVAIEIHAEGTTGLSCATQIDAIEVEIEAALAADKSAGGILENIIPGASTLEVSPDQDRIAAVRSIEYTAIWRHAFGAPDTPEG